MKVCILSYRGNMYSGGQGIYLYYLTRELCKLGHEVIVLVGWASFANASRERMLK